MTDSDTERTELADFLEQEVVLDTRGELLYVGRLTAIGDAFYTLSDADVHDLTDSNTSKEVYIMETAKHGVRTNRSSVHVRKAQVISLSKLSDVVCY